MCVCLGYLHGHTPTCRCLPLDTSSPCEGPKWHMARYFEGLPKSPESGLLGILWATHSRRLPCDYSQYKMPSIPCLFHDRIFLGLVETSHKVEVIVWRREFCPRLLELRSALCIQFFTTPPSTFSVGHRKDQTECHSTLHSTTWTPRENGSS